MAGLQEATSHGEGGEAGMKCDLCDRQKVEHIGIMCGKYKVCFFCIENLTEKALREKDEGC